jgi:hypothetical protein
MAASFTRLTLSLESADQGVARSLQRIDEMIPPLINEANCDFTNRTRASFNVLTFDNSASPIAIPKFKSKDEFVTSGISLLEFRDLARVGNEIDFLWLEQEIIVTDHTLGPTTGNCERLLNRR